MGVVATGKSCRTVSVDSPWTRVLNHFANNITSCDVPRRCTRETCSLNLTPYSLHYG